MSIDIYDTETRTGQDDAIVKVSCPTGHDETKIFSCLVNGRPRVSEGQDTQLSPTFSNVLLRAIFPLNILILVAIISCFTD